MHPSRKNKKSRVILGEQIRRLRTGKGWSQEELGEECSLHRTYIGGMSGSVFCVHSSRLSMNGLRGHSAYGMVKLQHFVESLHGDAGLL